LEWKEWIYCKGLMAANYSIWDKVWQKWEKTFDNTFLEYLTCSTDSNITRNYLRLTMENKFRVRILDNKKHANIVLLIIAKHAKHDEVLYFIFQNLKSFEFNIKTW